MFFDHKLAKTTAEQAANVIINGVLANHPKIIVGSDARFLDLLVRVLGSRYQGVVARVSRRMMPKSSLRSAPQVDEVA